MQKQNILVSSIEINRSSYVDPNGFLFTYQGEIYRAIRADYAEFYQGLFTKGVVDHLIKNGHLIESEIVDYQIEELNCPLVIKHRKISPLTYCVDWCPSMLKRAALVTMQLNLELLPYGCYLQDAYPWNVLFEGTKPYFIDFTSIVPINQNHLIWPAYQQFINFFINPLRLASLGKGNMARYLLQDYVNGVTINHINQNLTLSYTVKHPLKTLFSHLEEKLADKIQNNQNLKKKFQELAKKGSTFSLNSGLRKIFFQKQMKAVNNIRLIEEKTSWQNYYENIREDFSKEKKAEIVGKLLNKMNPQTVVDIGSNVGRYSMLAAQMGAKVISLDSSEHCIEKIFHISEKEKFTITPIIGDVVSPTPPFGLLSKQFPSLIQRVKSDVVLCLGLMHHLHVNGRQSFERIALLLNELSNKGVIFEYVDLKDDNLHLLDHGREIDYDIETVKKALSCYFSLECFESDRSTRTMILCQK